MRPKERIGVRRIPEKVTVEFSPPQSVAKMDAIFTDEKNIFARYKQMEMHFYLAYELEKHGLMTERFG
jgi:hypothetical protein